MKKKFSHRGSFLIEGLLAVSIIGIGLTVIVQSYLSSFRATVHTADYSLAVFLLESKFSELKEKGFIEDALKEDRALKAPYERFSYHLETRNIEEAGKPGVLNEVRLGVSWVTGRKDNKIFLTTYLFNLLP